MSNLLHTPHTLFFFSFLRLKTVQRKKGYSYWRKKFHCLTRLNWAFMMKPLRELAITTGIWNIMNESQLHLLFSFYFLFTLTSLSIFFFFLRVWYERTNREFADMVSSSGSSGTDSSDRSLGSSSSESHSLLRSHGPCSTESDDQVPNRSALSLALFSFIFVFAPSPLAGLLCSCPHSRDAGEEKIAVLYIQMQLYESSTLAQWLDNPQRTVNRSLNLFLFSQLGMKKKKTYISTTCL